jgi:hypothetical protein
MGDSRRRAVVLTHSPEGVQRPREAPKTFSSGATPARREGFGHGGGSTADVHRGETRKARFVGVAQ